VFRQFPVVPERFADAYLLARLAALAMLGQFAFLRHELGRDRGVEEGRIIAAVVLA